ncbi:MAG TPA: disulfide bond formation protein B [Stellaceae bacterium]|nr:disulfide bond formation protein B [Stellaceae bacterium]
MVTSRSAGTILLLASVAVIGTALLSQYVGGLQPCELCLYERWPYYAVIVLCLLALLSRAPRLHRLVFRLCALIFVASALLGLYHVGIEHHWIAGPSSCTGGLAKAGSVEALQHALENREPVQCDVPQWSYRGVTMAGLNLAASLALVLLSLWALNRRRFGRRR